MFEVKLRGAQRNFTAFSETSQRLSEISALEASDFISLSVELVINLFHEAEGNELMCFVPRNAA